MTFIGMTKKQAEIKLGRTLTNDEFSKYVWELNFGNKTKTQTKKTTKQQKTESTAIQEYFEEVKTNLWANDEKLQNYVMKKCSDVFKTSGGHFIVFEKPEIEKDFCFGYGMYGVSTEEDSRRAFNSAENARTNENYFLKENLKQFEDKLKMLEEEQTLYLTSQYYTSDKVASIKTEKYFWHYEFERKNIIETLTKEDIEGLKKVILNEKEKFVKRLNSYLKRYGLSKINSWAYLVD